MSKLLLLIAFATLTLSLDSCSGPAYVREQPNYIERARPLPPNPNYVWVDGEWVWRGNTYIRNEGYWVSPRPNRTYMAGHWEKNNRGYRWKKGEWR